MKPDNLRNTTTPIPPTLSPFMNTLPFINTNGLWKLDMPALMDPIMPSTNQLILVEAGIVTILDTLSANLFTSLTLEFHYQPIHPYDALLIKEGVQYKCVSLMTTNLNPDRIYVRIANLMV